MTGESVLEDLKQEHQAIAARARALGQSLTDMAGCSGAPPEEMIERALCQLDQLHRDFLLHRRREEEALFPAVQQSLSEGAPPVDIIAHFFAAEADDDLGAHLEIDGLMAQLALVVDALQRRGSRDAEMAQRLGEVTERAVDLLLRHAKKEDELVFPMMARALTPSQLEGVAHRMRAIVGQSGDPRSDG